MDKRILIVDDEKEICDIILSFILEVMPTVKFDIAGDGVDAFALCKDKRYDLIITDLKMPIMGGKEFIVALKTKENMNKETRVMIVSGFISKDIREGLRNYGLLMMEKPIDQELLTKNVYQVLSK
ncbi:MAG: response regulator [Bacteriovoracaceae bacterium]